MAEISSNEVDDCTLTREADTMTKIAAVAIQLAKHAAKEQPKQELGAAQKELAFTKNDLENLRLCWKPLEKLDMRHFNHLSIANRQITAAKQANYNAYPYENPDEDSEGNKPYRPSRVNPKVPVLRTSQTIRDIYSQPAPRAPPAPRTTPSSTALKPDVPSSKRQPLVLLVASGMVTVPRDSHEDRH